MTEHLLKIHVPGEAARRADIVFGILTALAISAATIYFSL